MNGYLAFLLFAATTYVLVFLKSWQQLNVIHDRWKLVLPVSMCIQACEIFFVVSAVKNGPGWIMLWGGLGAGCGTMTSMYINRRWMTK